MYIDSMYVFLAEVIICIYIYVCVCVNIYIPLFPVYYSFYFSE
jgi:hypothetical protein